MDRGKRQWDRIGQDCKKEVVKTMTREVQERYTWTDELIHID